MKDNQIDKLYSSEIPEEAVSFILAGAEYFENIGGTDTSTLWLKEEFDSRDDFFIVLFTYLYMSQLIKKLPPISEWRLKFEVCFLYNYKLNLQTAYSIDNLCTSNCYSDAISLTRIMHSRLNQQMLFALKPDLFNDWIKNPKANRYLDGKIRQELENNGIITAQQNYKFTSEIIHSQFRAGTEIGTFEQGIFPEVISAKNKTYITSKLILAMTFIIMLHIIDQDYSEHDKSDKFYIYQKLYRWMLNNYLDIASIDNLFAFVLAKDRHVVKVGKNKFQAGQIFDYEEFRKQIEKFHRKSGQQKKLSKLYKV